METIGARLGNRNAPNDRMAVIVNKFLDLLPVRLSKMHEALGAANFVEISQVAHQLKGTAAGLGFPEIGELAIRIEDEALGQARINVLAEQLSELEVWKRRTGR